MKRAALIALLRRIEWRADGYSCPDCGNMHREGHKESCELGWLLQGAHSPLAKKTPADMSGNGKDEEP